MKIIRALLLLSLSFAVFYTAYSAVLSKADVSKPQSVAPAATSLTLISKQFLSECSGADTSISSGLIVAYANCMGRIRGYADGHQITVEFQRLNLRDSPRSAPVEQLWCISSSLSDREVLDVVVVWVNTNPKTFNDLTTRYIGANGAMAVITKALHERFPCNKKIM